MWDEFVIGGDVQETSKKNVLKAISDQDMIQEVGLLFYTYIHIYLELILMLLSHFFDKKKWLTRFF